MTKLIFTVSIFICILCNNAQTFSAQDSLKYFTIRVVDEKTGRGVPMVEFRTSSQIRYYTDSYGIIGFNEPSLMNQWVSFAIFSHGYECTNEGLLLNTIPGTNTIVRITRLNIAERLYRITGQNIYGESVRIGLPVPIRKQGLNGKVLGQDTFIETLYKGKIYWFWGDTQGPASFNGHASGATSELPGKGGLDPGVGIDLEYFVDSKGVNKGMCAIAGPGLVWIDWLVTLPDEGGNEQLYAKYSRTKTLDLDYERGIALFDDSAKVFKPLVRVDAWLNKVHSSVHPLRIRSGDIEYFYLFDRHGIERVQADRNHILHPENYESFTCLAPGSKYNDTAVKLERDSSNKIVYAWKANTDALGIEQQNKLINSGRLSVTEGWFRPLDMVSGNNISLSPSSVFWNDFRKRWVMIAYEFCGGVWFVEGDTPTGPWVYGRKVVSHDNYDFYNVGQHPLFDQDGGRLIYFEGTYTTGFSGSTNSTPLYDYNQMMYRLALDDPRLSLPAPVYLVNTEQNGEQYLMKEDFDSQHLWESIKSIPFFALPVSSTSEEAIPVYVFKSKHGTVLTTSPKSSAKTKPLFRAIPLVDKPQSSHDPITGTWKCRALMQDTTEAEFELKLKKDGEIVTGANVTNGHYKNDTLSFQFMDNILIGKLLDSTLIGEIKKVDGTEKALWQGTRLEIQKKKVISSALAILYEYTKVGSKECYYSVDPNLSNSSITGSGRPICRVWRNPSSVLVLDYKAKPVQLER